MRSDRSGFTLIELLVVIGILAVLAALLLPLIANVWESGRRRTCQSNMRQIAAAIQLYTQDYDGTYPLETSVLMENGVPTQFAWNHALLPYIKDRRIFQCPSHPDRGLGEAHYTYNGKRLNTLVPRRPTALRFGNHEASLPASASIWATVDSGSIGPDGTLHDLRAVTSSCGRSFFGSTLHRGGGNYAFLDGHVQWLTPEAAAETDCQSGL
jgi:prepilin-type N-terminal cleavage/methylation domain-containing protein/prepilin-type processing-associated H-X9-DG protein